MSEIKQGLGAAEITATSTYPITIEKSVLIKHKFKTSILPESGLVNSSTTYVQRLGGAFAPQSTLPLGRTIFSSSEREAFIMSRVVGVSVNSQDWEAKLNEYWHNISVLVPYQGLQLNCSVVKKTKEDEGTPVNYSDYVVWLYATKHREVANTIEDVEKSPKIRFYIHDEKELIKKQVQKQDVKDQALLARMDVIKDINKAKEVLVLFGITPPNEVTELKLKLAQYAESNPLEFIAYCADEDLSVKSFIRRAIAKGVLVQPVNSTIILHETTTIGQNLDEATAYFKAPANAQIKATIENKMR